MASDDISFRRLVPLHLLHDGNKNGTSEKVLCEDEKFRHFEVESFSLKGVDVRLKIRKKKLKLKGVIW